MHVNTNNKNKIRFFAYRQWGSVFFTVWKILMKGESMEKFGEGKIFYNTDDNQKDLRGFQNFVIVDHEGFLLIEGKGKIELIEKLVGLYNIEK